MKKNHIVVLFLTTLIFGCDLAESLLADALVKSEGAQAGMSILQEVGKSLIDKVVPLKEKQVFGVKVTEGEIAGVKEALEGEEKSLEEGSEDKEEEQEEVSDEEDSDDSQSSDGVDSVVAGTTVAEVISSQTESETETVASSQRVSKAPETLVVTQEVSSQTVSVTNSVTKEEVQSPVKPAAKKPDNGGKKAVTNKAHKNENSNKQGKSSSSWWSWLFNTGWNHEW
ncbi:hypothetical protein bpSLO_001134 (plasmid) [Borrelia parkeri]|uniref:hypothetical protein n=1 Tax=Borrelia parkeri TaxID=141 RepID=UPI001FF3D025|nr:hypothetical protein [Borrelia parkeri]UPA11283.1 hypothetical protein bpSLO_001134 [Borrelia parkeri]